ncbi:DEAD/DEAH box helicase [Chryseobacterium sp. 5_R23647]|uniref:DEAD/DEAH box helicase n=1 Tax=Chryseobacterium sp. 5_R23647 TaxID=2258964 RepID=UPI000E21DFCD|nr:DEAD/DEAH box helicase family protein [Chryseobacterium sp. 5_R23647]REC45882.1 restriction endonuclease [Chryseobacterium sp. 5_R23647]
MELKSYQQDVINDLENFLDYLNKYPTAKAFNSYWKEKIGEYNPLTDSGMKPYKNNIPNATHIAIKVPTAGGKTFIAINALHSINKSFNQGNPKAVVWLVPWSNLLQQTYNTFSNPNHPYREKLNSLFGNKVEVYQKEQLLQAANFNPASATEQLNIFILNFSSLRIDKAKKEDRKIFQENGALEPFRDWVDKDLILEGTDETSLINIIRNLNPIVVVDESHNAESDLSVEMLRNLNPSLVLDLTATPKENSNIISFVSALKLKKEHMVKLPVVVFNHHRKEEVISSALHLQRKLELHAKEEEKLTGKYIRPIVLFQAQSNIKGKDNTTFQKIKEQLIKLQIPEEQIKIKVSGIDELKGVNLMDKNCPVKYIITINALKEGWDCPNAYILASLADKSSAVEVEQILGRVLRQPYVTKHQEPLLNMSFVLTASSKFQETLNNIVVGLQEAGFSREDYFAKNVEEIEQTREEILQQELFGINDPKEEYKSPKSTEEFELENIDFNPNDKLTLDDYKNSKQHNILNQLTEKATQEGAIFEKNLEDIEIDSNTTLLTEVMNKTPKRFTIDNQFKEIASQIKLSQFFIKTNDELSNGILFDELKEEETLLHKNNLLDGFNLLNCDTHVNFDENNSEVYKVDFDESKGTSTMNKLSKKAVDILTESILAKPKESQIRQVSSMIVAKLGDMTPLSDQDLKKYVGRIFENLTSEQTRDVINNDYLYTYKIKNKIKSLTDSYAKEKFVQLLDANEILVKPNFDFSEAIVPLNPSTAISKSLYNQEDSMNSFEQKMILEIASFDNIVFWHRNMSRGKGFFINGYSNNHYPDFIIYTQRGNIILLETKGDHLVNDETREKNRLGKKWAELSGNKYKYFMVFEKQAIEDCYNAGNIGEVLKKL